MDAPAPVVCQGCGHERSAYQRQQDHCPYCGLAYGEKPAAKQFESHVGQSATDFKKENPGGLLDLLGFLVVLGIAMGCLIAVGLQRQRIATDSEAWPSVEGRIEEAHVERVFFDEEYTKPDWARQSHYERRVTYTYEVGGSTYTGHRIAAFGRGYDTHGAATAALSRYEPGSRVNVRYDPEDPTRSVLVAGFGD